MKRFNHNYVFLGSSWDLYKFAYSDLGKIENAVYIAGTESRMNKLLQILCRFHLSPKTNKIIKLPFKGLWNKILFRGLTDVEDTVFVLDSGWVLLNEEISIVKYLKSKCKKAKFVWFLQDLYSKQHTSNGKAIDLVKIKKQLDLIVSFDLGDCEKYGFEYHPLVFSEVNIKTEEMPCSDVYFLGQAKNRLDEILSAYKYLRGCGLRCDFHIANAPVEKQKYADEIDYTPNFTYISNLQHIIHSKCLLEVLQKGAVGLTQRGVEIAGMDKMLITNNPRIHEAPFFNSKYIFQFKEPIDIPNDFIQRIKEGVEVNYNYKEKLSPVEFLLFIEEKLFN